MPSTRSGPDQGGRVVIGRLASEGTAKRLFRRSAIRERPSPRRVGVILAVAATAAIAVAGCGSSSSSSSSASSGASSASGAASSAAGGNGKTINIGNITSLSAAGGTFNGFNAGVTAFFKYYNAHGGVDGYKINLTSFDDAADPGKNATDARTLVESDHVIAIVGEASLADAASQKYLQGVGIPAIGGWAASSAWGPPATNMFVSLEGPNTPYCPLWSSDEAKAMGIKSMVNVAQAFPSAVQDGVCRLAAGKYQGVAAAIASPLQASVTAVDYRPYVQQAMSAGAGAIYFSTTAAGQIAGITAGQELGYKGLYIATQPSGLTPGLKSLGSAINGRVITSAFSLLPNDSASATPELAKFQAGIKQYEPAYTTDITAVSGWAAGKEFADALTAAGPNSKALISWLSKQTAYGFGGLQGPMNYTLGSRPNPCTTRLVLENDAFVRSPVAAKAPGFNCGVLINPKTGKPFPS
jgi:branched-chain amino acid transport system substrate-binding protein